MTLKLRLAGTTKWTGITSFVYIRICSFISPSTIACRARLFSLLQAEWLVWIGATFLPPAEKRFMPPTLGGALDTFSSLLYNAAGWTFS